MILSKTRAVNECDLVPPPVVDRNRQINKYCLIHEEITFEQLEVDG